ncbi:hypothetical protein SELMODRAFT_84808 [Selaginella moellendorffii]|uniref:Fungal lipase-type domain-containing protein n=1 Tax=Selaginella moellendorffii TaxID=88036 RepID=D8R3B1_SELML|nr:hypothetical protein SELMODRAFT_84808 [Selaginella moellendorffii]
MRCTPSLREAVDSSWQAKFAMWMMVLLLAIARGLAMAGKFVELWLNIFHVNGGLFKMGMKLVTGTGLATPVEESDEYWSFVGLLDPRTDLLLHQSCDEFRNHSSFFASESPASKLIADVCMMASKLAYENSQVIAKVVTEDWKMHAVDVFECINKYQPSKPTRLMIAMDRAENAQAIIVAFQGLVPFNAYDWSSCFDFSWYEFPGIGRVHVGCLEALSLVDRQDMATFTRLRRNIVDKLSKEKTTSDDEAAEHQTGTAENSRLLAYDAACLKLKELLAVHKEAKVYITGHSLGGALATVFTSFLFHANENQVTSRLAGVYTFGQPKAGDTEFAADVTVNLNHPENRFFRVVYSNDIVPRLPYEDLAFQFKHLGPCFFYGSSYGGETVQEEPTAKSLSTNQLLPDHAVATWELLQSLLLRYKFGEAYKETLASTMFRLVGLLFPGIAAHSPVNYINAIRLGPEVLDAEVMPN